MPTSDRLAMGAQALTSLPALAGGVFRQPFANPRDAALKEALAARSAAADAAGRSTKEAMLSRRALDLGNAVHQDQADDFAAWLARNKAAGAPEQRSLRSDVAAVRGDMGQRAQAMQQLAQTTDALGMDVPDTVADGLNVAGRNHLKNKTPEAETFAKGMGEVRKTSVERVMPKRAAEYAAKAREAAQRASKPKSREYTPADEAKYQAAKAKADNKTSKYAEAYTKAKDSNNPGAVLAEGRKQGGEALLPAATKAAVRTALGPLGRFAGALDDGASASPELRAYVFDRLAGPKSAANRGADQSARALDMSRIPANKLRQYIERLMAADKEE